LHGLNLLRLGKTAISNERKKPISKFLVYSLTLQPMNVKNWLQAFRLRTLPLAIGAITMGAFVAQMDGLLSWDVYILALLTAILLQILSNLANDYGDFKKGTDNDNRVGPVRALQSGNITVAAMLRAVILFSVLSLASGIALIWVGTKGFGSWETLAMLGVGLAAIAAAIKYTVGKSAYGYSGLGDVFVFVFFGLVAVCGTYYLMAGTFAAHIILPAVCFGCLATGVLNINNIRDIDNDKASNKITLAVRLGRQKAQYYHLVLMLVGFNTIFWFIRPIDSWLFYFAALVLFAPVLLSTLRVAKNKPGQEPLLNKELKALSLGSALFSVGIFVLSIIIL
jgi:1,4-dihydroxy-2-naphthoate polyprenyltransferase